MNSIAVAHSPLLLADVGLPMIIISLPAMIIALVPVIVVEALILRKRLSLTTSDAFQASSSANLISTFVGIPLAWIVAFVFQMVFGIVIISAAPKVALDKIEWSRTADAVFATLLSFAWIPEQQSWTIPLAQAVLLIPFFFASVWIERKMVRRSLVELNVDQSSLKRAVRDANLISYTGLLAITLGMITWLAILDWKNPGLFVEQIESRLNSGATTIDAEQLGDSTWDRLFIFDPYTPKQTVCETLNLAPKNCSVPRLGDQVDEKDFFIVLMQGEKISETDRLPRTIANFDRSCTAQQIPKGKAHFTVDRVHGNYLKCD